MAAGITTDFTVFPFSKTIRHTSATDTVHTVQEFYSYLMDLFDEPGYMSYEKPMKYNTPTSYTMLNGWFIDNGDGSNALKYLTGGSIDTQGYADGSADEILMIDLDSAVDFDAASKDMAVEHTGTTTIGPLLAYKNDYPATTFARIWVRNTAEVTAPVDGVLIDVTPEAGNGSGNIDEDISSGNEIYTNLYTIASFAGTPDPQVYVRQKHPVDTTNNASTYVRVGEWSTLDNFDPGSIDVLIPVQLGGALIDSGLVNVYVRQTGDTFTHVADVDLSAGSRTPVATESSADGVNITTGENYLLFDASTGASAFTIGDFIQNTASTGVVKPDWHAEVVAIDEFTTTTGLLTLRSVSGTITDNDSIYVLGVDSADVVGTEGDTIQYWATAGTPPDSGDYGMTIAGGTSTAERVIRGVDGTELILVLEAYPTHGTIDSRVYTGVTRNLLYKAFQDGEALAPAAAGGGGFLTVVSSGVSTTLIAGFSDITIAHINGTVTCLDSTGFTVGERVTWTAPGTGEAIYVAAPDSTTITLASIRGVEPTAASTLVGDISTNSEASTSTLTDANTEGFAFTLQSAFEYAAFVEGGSIYEAGRRFSEIYAYLQYKCRDGETDTFITSTGSALASEQGQFYITADSGYNVSKVAPFGTLAGTTFFGAQGVWVQGMSSLDNNNIKLTDATPLPQEPETSITLTVSDTRVGDTVAVFLKHATLSLPDKEQYAPIAGELEGESLLNKTAGTNFPNDTPLTGAVYVVATDEKEEHRYRYASWSGEVLTLATQVDATADGTTALQAFKDTSANFVSLGVVKGDIVHRTTGGAAWAYVISISTDAGTNDVLNTTVLSDGSAWAVGNVIEVNSLVQGYDASDFFFIPYLEAIESTGTDGAPGSETEDLTYVSARNVVIRARNSADASYYIQPFVVTNAISIAGMSQAVIRTEDTVYS